MLISHDLNVVRYLADRIGVMYLGRLVEQGPANDVFAEQRHPYTRALLSAAPDVDGTSSRRVLVHGDPPSAISPPAGCPFHPRCWLAESLGQPEICHTVPPAAVTTAPGQQAACHFQSEATTIQPRGTAQ